MRRFCTFLVLVVLPACARGDGPPRAKTIADIARTGPSQSPEPIRVQGTVTYFDPARRCLCLQDDTAGLFVHIPLDTRPLRPGQRAEARGRVLAHNYLDAAEVRAVGDDALPEPVRVTAEEFVAGTAQNRRVALAGVVRAAGIEADRGIIYLMAGRTAVRVFVRDVTTSTTALGRLVDAGVRVVGVCGPALAEGGPVDGMKLLVQSLDAVTVERRAPERPFELPLTAITRVPEWAAHRVRVAGEATGPVTDGVLNLRADKQLIGVAVGPEIAAHAGDRFEAVGFPSRRDGGPFLDDTLVRGFAPRRGVRSADARPEDLLPMIRAVSEIRRMTPEEVDRGHPVRLRATVLYHDPDDMLFVHDGTEGIFVSPPKALAALPPGKVVDVEGFTEPGFAPVIKATTVRAIRDGRLPEVRRCGYEELVGGGTDSQWVEIEAVVRGTGKSKEGWTQLMLRFGPTTVPACVSGIDPENLTHLFGSTVCIRAACGSTFTDRDLWSGLLFYIPGTDAIRVVRPAPADVAGLPIRTVESLSHFDASRGPGEPIRLNGVVIARRGTSVYVQDATGGIVADLQPGQPGAINQRVEVRGFLVRRGSTWAVEDGVTRTDGSAFEAPAAREVTPAEVASGECGTTLIRLEAILVDQFSAGDSDQIFLLRSVEPEGSVHLFYPAILPRDQVTHELAELRPGTRLRVTGACAMPSERLMVSSFRVIPRDANDFEILDRPTWWTARKALTVAGGVATIAILSMAWVFTLRRRVSWQTEQIRRRLEREAQLEARYRDLFESASDAVFALDACGIVKAMNRAGRDLTGLAEGASFLAAVAPTSLSDAKALLDSKSPVTRELVLNAPSGQVLLEVSARPTLDGGSSSGVQAIARDLTDRRRLESELRQAQKMEAIGRLAGGIAHDFNNLLTVINGNAEVLRLRLPAGESGLAEEIVRAGEHAATLTRQLLAFSRKGVIAPRVLCPNTIIDGVRRMLARLVGERVQLVTDLDDTVGCVRIDPGQLEQAMLNLAVNARDAMPQGGTLTIQTRTQPGRARIVVTDTGMGMDAGTRARAFEPFFTTKPAGEGTGLGLATVKGIVEQAGGTVTVASEPGRGSSFTIDLPLSPDARQPDSSVMVAPPPANREVILLVEDEPAVQLLERRVLEMGRYEVLVASSGEDALKLLDGHRGRIDLLVTDVVMPGMTGRELAEAVSHRLPGLRALFLSGYTPDEVLQQGIRAEEAHFLQKPFTPSALLGKVREILSRPL
jgi:two-component system, cell cycle sensor histidine kinase and response regulator CckA